MVSIVGFEPTVCNGFDEFDLIGGFKRPAAVCVYLTRYYRLHIEIHLVVTLLGTSPFRIPASVFQYGVCGGDSHPTPRLYKTTE